MTLDFITSVTFMPASFSKVLPYLLHELFFFVLICEIKWVSIVFDKPQTKLLFTLIVDEQIQF